MCTTWKRFMVFWKVVFLFEHLFYSPLFSLSWEKKVFISRTEDAWETEDVPSTFSVTVGLPLLPTTHMRLHASGFVRKKKKDSNLMQMLRFFLRTTSPTMRSRELFIMKKGKKRAKKLLHTSLF